LIPVYYTLYKRWVQWQESRRDVSPKKPKSISPFKSDEKEKK